MIRRFKRAKNEVMTKDIPILQLNIDNKQDIDLQDFNNAVQSLGNQYYSYLKATNKKEIKNTHKLYIKEVRKGSIIVELCEKAPELLPIITPSIVEFGTYIVNTMDWLTGKSKDKKYDLNKRDLLDFKNISELSANKQRNSTAFIGINFGSNVVNHHYNSTESAAAQNQCLKEIDVGTVRNPTQNNLINFL
jgi:hypothetical protein